VQRTAFHNRIASGAERRERRTVLQPRRTPDRLPRPGFPDSVSVGEKTLTHMSDEMREREISGVTVKIDRTLCIGSGNCTNLAPEIFKIDDQNLADFEDETPDIDQDRLVESCSICPVDALIVEQDGEQIVP
jgi:ferredoxin